jgi:uncharacterized protein
VYVLVIYKMLDFDAIIGFNWDAGNARKNDKHGVSMAEAEQVFFNAPLLVLDDAQHSQDEPRFHTLGKSDASRQLHITFTLWQKHQLIRVISARGTSKKERTIYEQS